MTDIKEKIKKLLAMTSSPFEGEAMTAMLKAKELMAKHKLTEADFEELKKQEMVHVYCDNIKWTTDSGEIWIATLCKLICDNYCCLSAWSIPYKTRTHTLQITGMQDDVEVCREVIEYAVGFVRSAIKTLQRKHRMQEPRAIASSYANGFIQGLEMAFEDQQDEHPEWGLVVVKPEEVRAYEESLGSKSVKTRAVGFDPLAHVKGFNDGKEFNSRRVLK